MKIVRKLYDWVLHWAETPYGPIALFFLAFAESSFFPVPPDLLLIALCLGAIKKSWRFAFYAASASILGGMAGYMIGFGLSEAVNPFFFPLHPRIHTGSLPESYGQFQRVWILVRIHSRIHTDSLQGLYHCFGGF